jgi:hypothetical protein
MTQYKLVNPTVVGKVVTTASTSSPDTAVKKIWENLSSNIMGNVPNLIVTIREEGTANLFHYNIQEKVNDNNDGEVTYEKINVKMPAKIKNEFLKEVDNVQVQHGAGHHKKRNRYDDDDSSSSSSSDSDDEFYKFMKFRKNTPISTYWYTPYIYSNTGSVRIYTPVWKYPSIPYNEIWIPAIF